MKHLLVLISLALITSCKVISPGTGDGQVSDPLMPFSGGNSLFSFSKTNQEHFPPSIPQDATVQRKTYYEAYLGIEVSDVEETLDKLKESIKSYDGYIVSSSKYGITFRVRADQFEGFVQNVTSMGDMTQKNITGTDVTDQYEDFKIQLDNANKARDQYVKLLDKAVTVEEVLKIEKELERITEKIELLEGRIKRLEQIISYSLVNVNVVKETTPGPIGWIFVGLWKGISWLFIWE